MKLKKIILFVIAIFGCCIVACQGKSDLGENKSTIIPTTEVLTQFPVVTEVLVPTNALFSESSLLLTVSPIPTATPVPTASTTPTSTPAPTVTLSPTPIPDVEPPVLTLVGGETIEVIARSEFVEPGWIAADNCDGDLAEKVSISGEVDVNWCGTYTLTYEVKDKAGNSAQKERVIIVKQPEEIIPEGKVIYLTFDDGPGKYTEELLNILEKYDIKATFFTCGNGQPELAKQIYEAGHTIGIHCRDHDYDVVYASEEAYFEDLFAMQDMIYDCTGVRTTLVRFPGGSSNTVSSFNPGIMTRLTGKLEQMGFQYFDWNVSSGDSGTKNTARILANLKKGVEAHTYSVVLQHPEVREFSIKAVEDFIIWALENEYTFLPLDATSPKTHHSVNN